MPVNQNSSLINSNADLVLVWYLNVRTRIGKAMLLILIMNSYIYTSLYCIFEFKSIFETK